MPTISQLVRHGRRAKIAKIKALSTKPDLVLMDAVDGGERRVGGLAHAHIMHLADEGEHLAIGVGAGRPRPLDAHLAAADDPVQRARLLQDGWLDDLPIDEAVPMLFRMGPGERPSPKEALQALEGVGALTVTSR